MKIDERQVLDQLIEIGELQGQVTAEDILGLVPEAEEQIELLETIYDALGEAGIPYVEHDEQAAAMEDDEQSEELPTQELAEISAKDAIDIGDTVGAYLSQVGQVPLLTRAEEGELSKRIERGRAARQELARAASTARQRAQLVDLINDGVAAREHLILANSRLVISVAKKYAGRGVPFLDLIQEGHIGLMRAVKKFDYRRGFKFSTYATWWIRQAISRAVADHGRTIRVPVHMGDRINKMRRLWHRLTQELGRDPTAAEVAEALGEPLEKVEDMLRVAQRPLSLERPVDEGEDSLIGDFIEDEEAPAPEEVATEHLREAHLQNVLDTLPFREARVLQLRYGLHDGRFHTLQEVGLKMGITRERVRQIESQALRRLRSPDNRRELYEYVR
jgi:RNA polymerase primary sigma factor